MNRFFKTGGAFLVLAIVFMVIAAMAEKPAAYISLGAFWLILGLAMAARHKKETSSDQDKDAA
jgi:preprotein translocase subunit SecG